MSLMILRQFAKKSITYEEIMRKPEYLSPTSISLHEKDVDEFYSRYLADNKMPRMAQTQPMAIGSAFDAFCKSYLH